MSRKDYVELARITGRSLAVAQAHGGEAARTALYEALYEPLVAMLILDNSNFDQLRFSFAVGEAEQATRPDWIYPRS